MDGPNQRTYDIKFSFLNILFSSGTGYVRSEAVVTVFLQKHNVARRVYGTIVHAGINSDGYKTQGVTYPSGDMQGRLIQKVFREGNLNRLDVSYVEVHGTGTKAGDPEELDAVSSFFCPGRKEPLLVGGVKSNMGHAESSSGLVSVTKVLIAMETGVIPGNLHFKEPNTDIPSLLDGRLTVVDKNTPWKEGMVAINSFGFGGANAHVVLRPSHIKTTPEITERREMPRLLTISGRTQEAVNAIFDQVSYSSFLKRCPIGKVYLSFSPHASFRRHFGRRSSMCNLSLVRGDF